MRQSPCDRCCHHPFQTEVDSSVTVLHNLQDTHSNQSLITNVTLQLSRFQFVSQLVSPSDVKKKKKDMLSICIPGVTLSVAIACSK